ncbi:unnamed protein product [Litomosoides sigmodontis]|uniref:Uncharacterized protein n=1 Tax=Litomosoides sigmodontis TaxID=42156 RepID=A0A3P6TSR5_LITSI|nr:unnamed protein product [Litomosoides sigmodontis]
MLFRKKPNVAAKRRSVKTVTSTELPDSVSSSKNTWYSNAREINSKCKQLSKQLVDYRPITPIPSFDVLPASIPRIVINKAITNAFPPRTHYNTTSAFHEHSPRSDDSCGFFSHSTHSDSGDTMPSGSALPRATTSELMIPLKKLTKESRLISVHDGRPVSPYIKTVAYVPKYSSQECLLNTYNRNYHYNNRYPKQVTYEDERYSSKANITSRNGSSCDSCSFFVENPLYTD